MKKVARGPTAWEGQSQGPSQVVWLLQQRPWQTEGPLTKSSTWATLGHRANGHSASPCNTSPGKEVCKSRGRGRGGRARTYRQRHLAGKQWPSQNPGPLGAATRRECPSQPGPGHQCPRQPPWPGSVYFQGEAGSGFQVGVRGNSVLTRPPPQLPSAVPGNRASFSAAGSLPAWLAARLPGRVEKSTQTNAPPEPAPLRLCHILHIFPRRARHTRA